MRLTAISEREVDDKESTDQSDFAAKSRAMSEAQARQQQQQAVAAKMLMTAIGALGQRFVIALATLFTLMTAASAFYLWMLALPEINTLKIIGLTIYSLFVLALNMYGRKQ